MATKPAQKRNPKMIYLADKTGTQDIISLTQDIMFELEVELRHVQEEGLPLHAAIEKIIRKGEIFLFALAAEWNPLTDDQKRLVLQFAARRAA